jgi:hypothetical protein
MELFIIKWMTITVIELSKCFMVASPNFGTCEDDIDAYIYIDAYISSRLYQLIGELRESIHKLQNVRRMDLIPYQMSFF